MSRDTTTNVVEYNSVVLKHPNLTQVYFSNFIGILLERPFGFHKNDYLRRHEG
ncbi:TPA: hypothetical protein ACH0PD_000294 [Legionella pneumophila]